MVIFLMFRTISSMKGSLSPGWRATKCRRHLLAILMNVSQAISWTPARRVSQTIRGWES